MANSSNGTFEISDPPRQSNVMSDRDPLIKKSNPLEGGVFKGLIQPCLCELVGTTLFVFIGTICNYQGVILTSAITHGFGLAFLVATFGAVSGGHFNPAVTFGVVLSGGMDVMKAFGYFICQIVGGILGAAITKGVLTESQYISVHGGSHMLPESTSVGQGILCEMSVTTMLVFCVVMTSYDEDWKNPLGALAVGFVLVAGISATGAVTGASMNPARSFGPAVVASSDQSSQWDYHYIYWVGPLLGSVVASLIYRLGLACPAKLLIAY